MVYTENRPLKLVKARNLISKVHSSPVFFFLLLMKKVEIIFKRRAHLSSSSKQCLLYFDNSSPRISVEVAITSAPPPVMPYDRSTAIKAYDELTYSWRSKTVSSGSRPWEICASVPHAPSSLARLQAYENVVWISGTSDRCESSVNGCENFRGSRRITGPAQRAPFSRACISSRVYRTNGRLRPLGLDRVFRLNRYATRA